MTPEEYRRAGELFEQVIALPPESRREFLEAACGAEHQLRDYVAALVEAEGKASDSFLERPAIEHAVNLIAERAASSPPLTGAQLGAYRLGGQIGSGGMATVYEAVDVRLGRKVAIKILPPAFFGDRDRVRRFRQEARVVSLLNHPNIVSIYDAELEQDPCYIATEFVEGKTLRQIQLTGARPMELGLFLDIAVQICSALAAAHESGIVHRDIKPENVMVRPDGLVKVLDFGLAKQEAPPNSDATDVTRTLHSIPGILAGTAQYLAPEQIMGKPASPQSDIFSLGVTLYEVLTGVRPFTGPTDAAVLAAIVNQTPSNPSSLRPGIGAHLESLILRTLEKDPELRIQTAGDLRSALKLVARGSQPAIAAPAPAPPATRRVLRRAAGWAMATALGGALATGWYLWSARYSLASDLPQKFTRLTDAPGEQSFPALNPDGSQFLYASRARGKWDIYLQRSGGSAAENLTAESSDDDSEPALSRDGQRIAFRSERGGGGLFVMESTGENPTRIAPRGHLPAWSPDGKSIVYSDDTFATPSDRSPPFSRLHIIDVSSGASRDLQTGDAIQPDWSPHGYRIAYWGLQRGGQRDIWTVGTDGSQPVAVTDDLALDWNPAWSPDGTELYFISDRGGSMNVWRVAIDERTGKTRGAPQPFTMPASYIRFLRWAANGRRFIFSQAQRRVSLYSAAFDKAAMETRGELVAAATTSNITNFTFSPDGRRIVYDTVGDTHEDLWTSNLDGSGRRRLVGGSLNRAPEWSPDGSEILFFSNRGGMYDLWLIHPDGSGLRRLTAAKTSDREVQGSKWIEGGARILAGLQVGGFAIVDPMAGVPAADLAPLRGFAGMGRSFVQFGPPENGLVLVQVDDKLNGIAVYSISTGRLEPLPAEGNRPIWVPGSSRQLVYKRRSECYLYDLDTKREKLLFSVAPNQIYALRFDNSGSRLYFTQTMNDANLWMGQTDPAR